MKNAKDAGEEHCEERLHAHWEKLDAETRCHPVFAKEEPITFAELANLPEALAQAQDADGLQALWEAMSTRHQTQDDAVPAMPPPAKAIPEAMKKRVMARPEAQTSPSMLETDQEASRKEKEASLLKEMKRIRDMLKAHSDKQAAHLEAMEAAKQRKADGENRKGEVRANAQRGGRGGLSAPIAPDASSPGCCPDYKRQRERRPGVHASSGL